MSRQYRGRRGGYKGRSYGREMAERHIREAIELSAELGGTDQDVKRYFFSLSPDRLRQILEQYGRLHGEPAREYAEKTILGSQGAPRCRGWLLLGSTRFCRRLCRWVRSMT